MKKLLIIYNPVAGKSIINIKLGEMIEYYTSQGFIVTAMPLFEYLENSKKGNISAEDYDAAIVTGGDGSVHEAVNGGLTKFGYVPCGSANDIGHSLGISMDIDQSKISSVKNDFKVIDIGRFNDEIFVYVAAFGLFTEVTYATPQKIKKDLGYLAYILQGIKSLADVRGYYMTITTPDGKCCQGEYMVGLIANSYSIGGFRSPLSDEVALDDGLFEAVFIRKPNDLIEFNEMMAELVSNPFGGKYVDYIKTDKAVIECKSDVAWTLDGDFGGSGSRFEIECIKQALSIR